MATQTAADAMQRALGYREESGEHNTLQNQLTVSLDRHQTALDQMSGWHARRARTRCFASDPRGHPYPPQARIAGSGEEPAKPKPSRRRDEPVPPRPRRRRSAGAGGRSAAAEAAAGHGRRPAFARRTWATPSESRRLQKRPDPHSAGEDEDSSSTAAVLLRRFGVIGSK